MGNEAEFHFGKRRPAGGLEFVEPAKKRSSFRHITAQFEETTAAKPKRASRHPVRPTQQESAAMHIAAVVPTVTPAPKAQAPLIKITDEYPEMLELTVDEAAQPLDHIYQEPTLTRPVTQEEKELMRSSSKEKMVEDTSIVLHQKPPLGRRIFSYVVTVVALVVLIFSILYIKHNLPNIPQSVVAKAGFSVYDITPSSDFVLDKSSVQLAKEGNVVYFVDEPSTKAHFVISQQKIPDIVKADNDYQQFLSDSDKYADTNTKIGKAYFTRPANIGSDISVVVKSTNSLLFIRGPGTTSDQDWSKLLQLFKVVK